MISKLLAYIFYPRVPVVFEKLRRGVVVMGVELISTNLYVDI